MSRTVTLSDIHYQARLRADKVGSTYIKKDELTSYVNSSYAELYDLLVGAYGNDYYLKLYTFATSNGVDEYSLPADFYKLIGIDFKITASRRLTLRPFQFNERNRYQEGAYWSAVVGISGPRYHLQADKIKFRPKPDGNYDIDFWYIPACPILVNDADTIDGVNGWEEYIFVDCAIKMLSKEESDVSHLEIQKQRLIQRINTMAENRDAGQTFRVSDVQKDWLNIEGDTYRY